MHSKVVVTRARKGEQLSLERIHHKAINAVRYVYSSLIFFFEDSKDYGPVSVDRELQFLQVLQSS